MLLNPEHGKWRHVLHSLVVWPFVLAGGSALAAPDSSVGAQGASDIAPSLEIRGVYRSNVYLQEGEVGGGSPTIPGFHIAARPELSLLLNDSSTAHLNVVAAYSARKFVTEGLSNLDRFNDFDFRSSVNVAPDGKLGLSVKDHFSLKGYETEASYADTAYVQRLDNLAGLMVNLRPGPDLELNTGGFLEYEDYRNDAGTSELDTPSLNTRLAYGPSADLRFKFIPKTAFIAEYDYTWFYWKDNFVVTQGDGLSATDDLGERMGIPDGTMSQFTMGLRGRFTKKLVLGVLGGVTSMIYDEQSVIEDASNDQIDGASSDIDPVTQGFGQDLKIRCAEEDIDCAGFPASLTATVDLAYEINETNAINVSYRRDFQDVYFTNFVAFHQVSTVVDLTMWNRLGVTGGLDYRFEDYEGEVNRSDHLIRLKLDGRLALSQSISLDLGTWWTRRASASSGDSGDRNPYIEFDDLNLHGGLTFSL